MRAMSALAFRIPCTGVRDAQQPACHLLQGVPLHEGAKGAKGGAKRMTKSGSAAHQLPARLRGER